MGNDPGSATREVGFAPRGIGGLRPFWGFSRGEGGVGEEYFPSSNERVTHFSQK